MKQKKSLRYKKILLDWSMGISFVIFSKHMYSAVRITPDNDICRLYAVTKGPWLYVTAFKLYSYTASIVLFGKGLSIEIGRPVRLTKNGYQKMKRDRQKSK